MKKIILLLSLGCFTLAVIIFFLILPKKPEKVLLPVLSPHIYDDTRESIKNIHITIFYFVPKNMVAKKIDNWTLVTEGAFKELSTFHSTQFLNTSTITYSFFPKVIIGTQTSQVYEPTVNEDSPDALTLIEAEIKERVYSKEGDLYDASFLTTRGNTKELSIILFEGEGGAGKKAYGLVSRSYLTDKEFSMYGSTILAHEFYHTLGVPDNYQKSMYVYDNAQQKVISLIKNGNIMGRIDRPLVESYLDKETLIKMGL